MNNLLNKKNVIIVKKYLQKIDSKIKLIELDTTARTAKDAADSLNEKVGSIVKSLIFKTNDNNFLLCLTSGDKYISIKKLTTITNKTITKATADEVKKQTGFSIGGVSPVAHLNPPLNIYIDKNFMYPISHKTIVLSAGG